MTQTVVITGANRGIGLALTRAYLARGAKVFAACRRPSDALLNSEAKVIDGIDVTQNNALDKLKNELGNITIDILINNAGILRKTSLQQLDEQQIIELFMVNALAPLKVTRALLDNLHAGSKVAMITSHLGSIADNKSGGSYGYRMSKAALNAAGKSLAIDLKDRNIAVALLHPGWVSTEMVNYNGLIEPEESAAGLMQRIDGLNLENSGGFWHSNGEKLPW